MASNRINRINEEMQKSIAGKLRSVKDPRVANTMISVTPMIRASTPVSVWNFKEKPSGTAGALLLFEPVRAMMSLLK